VTLGGRQRDVSFRTMSSGALLADSTHVDADGCCDDESVPAQIEGERNSP